MKNGVAFEAQKKYTNVYIKGTVAFGVENLN
jgi:hypothetical protein